MGRSVSVPSGAHTVCYRDISTFGYEVDEDGNTIDDEYDPIIGEMDFENFEDSIVDTVKANWPSFGAVENQWIGREDRVLAENQLCQIGMSTYCGLASIWLIVHDRFNSYQPEEEGLKNLAENFANRISDKFEELFGEYIMTGRDSTGTGYYVKK